MKVTKEEMLKRFDEATEETRELAARYYRDYIWQERIEVVNVARALIERADDVDRLVSAAKEADELIYHIDGKICRMWPKLHAALAPFMEKERGNVPIFNEEGNSNEEKP